MTIIVTKDHIKESRPGFCPIYIALLDLDEYIYPGYYEMTFRGDTYKTPPEAKEFMLNFEAGLSVLPKEFVFDRI